MLSFYFRNGVPGAPADFIDGWMGWMGGMDGWMGWVGFIFFGFVYFSKTTSYIILIVSGPLRRHFQVCFVKKWKKIKKLNFVKKFRTFRKIFGFLTIFEKKYREISCIFTNYGGILVLHVLCFSLPPTPKNTHSPPNHPYPPNPQTPYDPLEVLIPSHTNITVTNNYVMVIVILFIKI